MQSRKCLEDPFCQAVEEFVIGNVRRELAFLAVEKKKVNIRAVIQLAAAEFSERENRKFRRWRSMALSQVGVPMFEHPTDANLGDLRKFAGRFFKRCHIRKLA